MLTPALAKGDSIEDVVARLSAAKDPAAAYLKLDPSEQQAVREYLTVVAVVETTTSPVADDSNLMTVTAGGCWTWTWNRQGHNVFGVVMWQFNQKIDWCSNGSTLTSRSRQVWTSSMGPFWSYNGLVSSSESGGVGYSYYHSYVQGSYSLCYPWVGCMQYAYPWLDMTAHANGSGTGSGGNG